MSRRGALAAIVLTAWAGGLGVLVARETNPPLDARIAEVALRITPVTTYYAVERDGHHAGFAYIAFDTVPRALQVTEYLVTAGDGRPRIAEQLSVRFSRGLSLRDYELTRTAGSDSLRVAGRVSDLTLVVEGDEGADSLPVVARAFTGAIVPAVAALLDEPAPGSRTTLATLDPVSGRPGDSIVRVLAESLFVVVDSAVADSSGRWFAVHRDTVRAWRLASGGPPALDAWVDAQGLVVEARRTDGLVLRRTAFELAFENWRLSNPVGGVSATASGNVVASTLLAAGVSRPAAARESLSVRIESPIPRDWSLRFGRQWRQGGTISFSRPGEARLRSRYSLPTSDRWRRVFTRELSPAPYLDSDDPRLEKLAARLSRGETDPAEVALRIVKWVSDSVRAAGVGTGTTASQVLAGRQGDAREFALLLTALSRAAGVPAQPVAGLLEHDGRFYLHAWAEVYTGRWVPVDAMLGQYPADASHVGLVNGSAELGPDLARVLGRLKLSTAGKRQQTTASRPPTST